MREALLLSLNIDQHGEIMKEIAQLRICGAKRWLSAQKQEPKVALEPTGLMYVTARWKEVRV
jgi:hypothetical protein